MILILMIAQDRNIDQESFLFYLFIYLFIYFFFFTAIEGRALGEATKDV